MSGNHGTGWGRPLRTDPDHAAIPKKKQAADAPPTQSTKTKHQQPAGHSLGAPPDGCECPGPSWA